MDVITNSGLLQIQWNKITLAADRFFIDFIGSIG